MKTLTVIYARDVPPEGCQGINRINQRDIDNIQRCGEGLYDCMNKIATVIEPILR